MFSTDGLALGAGVLLAIIVALSLLFFVVSRYRRCPPNRLLVISGRTGQSRVDGGRAAKIINGGGDFVWPVIQEAAFLDLTPIPVKIDLKDALSLENIRVAVPSVFTVAIGADSAVAQNAAVRILGLTREQVAAQAQEIIFGQLRAVIASLKIEEINRDRDAFRLKIQKTLEPELERIGVVLLNVNIVDLKDESGYIEAIGKKAASQAVQQARGDVAEQEKQGEIRVAEANREKEVQVAAASRDREIGLREAARAQAVRVAELEKEERIGQQTAAFEADARVAGADQLKRVAVASANAEAVAGEATAQAKVAQTNAALRITEAEAFQRSETARRTAEAKVQEAQHRAMADAAVAQAERAEAEERARLEAPAKAEKARMIVEAEADAERVRIAALADAEAIRARLSAQAEGEYQILAKRAQAIGDMVDKAGSAEDAYRLMLIDHLPKLMEIHASAISQIKFDKVVLWSGQNGDSKSSVGSFIGDALTSLPPLFQVLQDVGGFKPNPAIGTMAAIHADSANGEASNGDSSNGDPAEIPDPLIDRMKS